MLFIRSDASTVQRSSRRSKKKIKEQQRPGPLCKQNVIRLIQTTLSSLAADLLLQDNKISNHTHKKNYKVWSKSHQKKCKKNMRDHQAAVKESLGQ